MKRYILTFLFSLSFLSGFSQATKTLDSLNSGVEDSSLIAAKSFTSPAEPAWLNVGLGRSLNYPLALNLEFSRPWKTYLFTARFQLTDELDLHRQSSSESLWDIGLLFGKMFEKGHQLFTFSAGLGYMGGRIRGAFIPDESGWGGLQKMKNRSSIGIPIEIQYIRTLSASVGVGLTAFGDLNTVQPFVGIVLSLHLGQLP